MYVMKTKNSALEYIYIYIYIYWKKTKPEQGMRKSAVIKTADVVEDTNCFISFPF